MNIPESRKIGLLEGNEGIPVIVPHFPPRSPVLLIESFGCLHVGSAHQLGQGARSLLGIRRPGEKMVVVRKNRPSPESPSVSQEVLHQNRCEMVERVRRPVEWLLVISCSGHHVDPRFEQPVGRRMRPASLADSNLRMVIMRHGYFTLNDFDLRGPKTQSSG